MPVPISNEECVIRLFLVYTILVYHEYIHNAKSCTFESGRKGKTVWGEICFECFVLDLPL